MFGKIKEAFSLERWVENFEGYLDARIELAKYDVKEALVGILAKSFFIIGFAFFTLLALICLNFGIAYLLNAAFGNHYAGFMVLSGIYFLIGLIFILGRKNKTMHEKLDNSLREILQQPKKEEEVEAKNQA